MPQWQPQQGVGRTPQAPGVFVSPYTYARQTAAVDSLGRRLGAMGAQFADIALRMDAMQRSREIADTQTAYRRFYKEHLDALAKDRNYTDWPKGFEQRHDAWAQENLGKIKSGAARQELENWLANEKISRGEEITVAANRHYTAETRSTIPGLVQGYIEEAAGVSPASEKLLRADLQRKLTEYRDERILYSGEIERHLADFDQGLGPVREAQAYAHARAMAMAMPDKASAVQFIDALPLEREQRNDLLAQIGRKFDLAEAQAKTELDAQQEKDRAAILDRMLKKQFDGIEAFIRGTSLDLKEQKTQINECHEWARQVNKGVEIESDKREEARLEKLALDVSTGAVSLKDFAAEARQAAYGDKPTIDTAAFDSLMGIANREHQTYQANALKEAIDYGQTQLISTTQLEQMAEAYEEDIEPKVMLERFARTRKFEQENLAEYRRGLREWFEAEKKAGREPDDDQIYLQSRKMLVHFKGRTAAGLEEGKGQRYGKPAGVAAYAPDGTQVGVYNADGTIMLNIAGLRRLREITGGDKQKARQWAAEQGYTIPE